MTDMTHYEFALYENLVERSTVAASAPWSIVSQNVSGNEIVRLVCSSSTIDDQHGQ